MHWERLTRFAGGDFLVFSVALTDLDMILFILQPLHFLAKLIKK
jgi:hypothetical protein